ncbi:MAG: 3-oxoacid CoA-transferase subunit A [Acidimicrobiaceae bacterium]|nr:3-oxoacid CoA-transferase subunit A [Acidimicrobiaceae bacterium]MXY12076.1 3-oxoacid CoA-transferase subunit A [Acidimicrobiaceae bacterium]MXZ67361.1 3-oxoacid CoA-transferase subunit A [Acidimicrobiaceae bacterium]MYF33922.1 3-oxoacid CoA-transferase subunit A [Acidimicrobiaceae bacterium]MYG80188.1 3-oxoacid CoA-transferase subunit A [Acidimicrobiaceae bacterium]
MIDKRFADPSAAVRDIGDGATIMVGGFGEAGSPVELIDALIEQGAGDLTVISNNAGSGTTGLAALIKAGRVAKMICSYPRSADSEVFAEQYRAGRIGLELVPQGTLAERIRAAGAGIPAFYTPTAVGTSLAQGKPHGRFDDRECVLEHALGADVALIKAAAADRHGNLVYSKTARNFAPLMATAAETTIAQTSAVVGLGSLDPEAVVTPGIFVDRVVLIDRSPQWLDPSRSETGWL